MLLHVYITDEDDSDEVVELEQRHTLDVWSNRTRSFRAFIYVRVEIQL